MLAVYALSNTTVHLVDVSMLCNTAWCCDIIFSPLLLPPSLSRNHDSSSSSSCQLCRPVQTQVGDKEHLPMCPTPDYNSKECNRRHLNMRRIPSFIIQHPLTMQPSISKALISGQDRMEAGWNGHISGSGGGSLPGIMMDGQPGAMGMSMSTGVLYMVCSHISDPTCTILDLSQPLWLCHKHT